jgi:hypothetical protein
MKLYCLVYQGAIANVFEVVQVILGEVGSECGVLQQRKRILQSTFSVCEAFCAGIRHLEQPVSAAWCDEAGDIACSRWHFVGFRNAPHRVDFQGGFVLPEQV